MRYGRTVPRSSGMLARAGNTSAPEDANADAARSRTRGLRLHRRHRGRARPTRIRPRDATRPRRGAAIQARDDPRQPSAGRAGPHPHGRAGAASAGRGHLRGRPDRGSHPRLPQPRSSACSSCTPATTPRSTRSRRPTSSGPSVRCWRCRAWWRPPRRAYATRRS